MLAGLKHLRHRQHDVVVFQLFDPAEIDFPFRRVTMFNGLEATGRIVVEPHGLRAAYQREMGQFQARVRDGCRRQQIEYLVVRTDQPFGNVLAAFLAARKKRVQ